MTDNATLNTALTHIDGKPLYKVLIDGKSCHGGNLEWSLSALQPDGSYLPGNWHEVEGEISVCNNGLHLTTNPWGVWMKWTATVYEAEGDGDSDTSEDKTAFRRARLLRPAPVPDWWTAAHEFVSNLSEINWLKPDGNPDPSWRLFTASTWAAARNAAWNAAGDAARNAAGNAAGAAAGNAAGDAARNAAGNAARNAAGDAARDAAGAAARDAAGDAARDARLYITTQIIARDLDIAPEHRAHVEARWNAWRKGSAVLCDVDGVLYVYAATSTGSA